MATLLELQSEYALAEVEKTKRQKKLTYLLTKEPWELERIQKCRASVQISKWKCDGLFREIESRQTKLAL